MNSVLHVMPSGPILRAAPYEQALKNKAYRRVPVGRQLGRYLDELRYQGYPETTRDSYETTYNRLALDHSDFTGLDGFCTPVGTEYLREFLMRHWSDAAQTTKAQRLSAVKSAFAWAASREVGICQWDPAAALKAPRGRGAGERLAYPQEMIHRLVAAQTSSRDQCAIQLVARLGLRKNALRELKVRDIDLVRNLLTYTRKGGGKAVMPIGFPSLIEDLYLHVNGDQRQPDEYLVYPKGRKRDPMDHASVHRWFKRCLERAGLPSTMKLHEMRHTAGDYVYRQTGDIVRASQLLGHKSVVTTQTYLHPTRQDLAAALVAIDEGWGN